MGISSLSYPSEWIRGSHILPLQLQGREAFFQGFVFSIHLFYEIFQFHPWNKLIFGDPNNVLGLENEKNGQVREEETKGIEGSKGKNRCCCCSVETGTAILR